MITVTFKGKRMPFDDAVTYDYVVIDSPNFPPYRALALFDIEGSRIATFYEWEAVDAGETP